MKTLTLLKFLSILLLLIVSVNSFGQWTPVVEDIDGQDGSWFGSSVSKNAGGNILAVGAPNNDESDTNSREVSFFENTDGAWVQKRIGLNYRIANNIATGSRTYEYQRSLDPERALVKVYEYSYESVYDINLGSDTIICDNSTIVLDAGYALYYEWSTGEDSPAITVSDSGYYYVTVTDLFYSITDSIHIGLKAAPFMELLNDTLICSSDTISITSGIYNSYLWNTGENTESISVNAEGLYSLTVSNINNCFDIDSVYVEHIEVITGIYEYLYVPLGTDLTLTANSENTNIWNDEVYANSINYLATNDTILFLQATDTNSCTVMESIIINIYPAINYNCEGDSFDCNNDFDLEFLIEDVLIGDNISVTNISSNITDQDAIGYFCNPNEPFFGLNAGVVFSTGSILDLPNPVSQQASSNLGSGSDPDLENISSSTINDAVIIEFDYMPYTNIMSFSYIFGSEEFPEYVNSSFNDAFGFFLTGESPDGLSNYVSENIALLPNGQPVTIDNVFPTPFYYDNEGNNGQSVVLDGYTLPLDAVVEVVPFTTYHIKLAVGDAGDLSFDSGVFLSNNSFNAWPLQYNLYSNTIESRSVNATAVAIEDSTIITVEIELPVVAQTDITYHYSILGTAENGVDYETISDSITFLKDSIKATIEIKALPDNLFEPLEKIILVMDFLNDTISVDLLSISEITPDTLFFDNPNLFEGIDEHINMEIEICDIDLQEIDSAVVFSYSNISDTTTEYSIYLYNGGEFTELVYHLNYPIEGVYELEIYIYCSINDSSITVIKLTDYIDTDIFTGIIESPKSNISIYPNPAQKAFTVQNDNYKGKSYTINCYSSIGVLLYSKVVDSDKTSIEISHWAEGIYIIEVDREKMKFIKK